MIWHSDSMDDIEKATYPLIDRIRENPDGFRRACKSSTAVRSKLGQLLVLCDEVLRQSGDEADCEFSQFSNLSIELNVAIRQSETSQEAVLDYADRLAAEAERLKDDWPEFIRSNVLRFSAGR